MSRKSSTETLIAAMRILARDIQSGDGVANAAIAEAADRLAELHADHLRDATKMAEQQALIGELEKSVEWWQGCTKDCGDVINDGIESRQQLRANAAELEAQAAIGRRAVEMLSDIDHDNSRRKGLACCPSCGDWDGHHALCELAAILREYSEVSEK